MNVGHARAVRRARAASVEEWWHPVQAVVLRDLDARPEGLTRREAAARLRRDGANRLPDSDRTGLARSIARRLANPLIVVLLCASAISAFTGDPASFGFIVVIVLMSIALDMVQEHRAGRAVEALRRTVALRVRAWRDGRAGEVPAVGLVAGDVVELSAGDLVPADGRVLSASHFFVDQASLTGEAWPVEKVASIEYLGSEPLACAHAIFMGSSVVTGSARMLVCATGPRTLYGRLASSLAEPPAPTSFERGTRRFGILLARLTIALVLFVLLINTLYHRPLLESFLFAVALAVGLTPELLPMIVSVTLARGAVRMAKAHVIVKRLSAVQDLGAMDVLCTDKTGTLTESQLRLDGVFDAEGRPSARVFELAWLNSHFETGLKSGLDDAILAHDTLDATPWRKLDEVAFDFERRRVSVLLERDGTGLLIVKGAPEDILRLSSSVDPGEGHEAVALDDAGRARVAALFAARSAQGLRLLAVATRRVGTTTGVSAADEDDLAFAGFVSFADPPKLTTPAALASLAEHGVALKIVTGDNEAVTRHLCGVLGIAVDGVLSGPEIAALDDLGLRAAAARATLFCRVTPEQKSRVVRALQAGGHVVGYLGDGINDAPPLHVADVGISVDSGAEVAKQAADMVLLRHDLGVLRDGIREGRRTLINVNKYVLMATSSNFGNMMSMAAAALFLPFLPMRPLQILLNNFLYDVSELPIPTDRVADADLLAPRRWDTAFIRNFMLTFGLLSSIFDLLAFAVFYNVLHTPVALFQTAWFVQSMATQVLIVFVIRTARSPWSDRPSALLALSSVGIVAVAVALPYLPWAAFFGLVPMPASVLGVVAAFTLAYLVVTELAKHLFYRLDLARRHRPAPQLVASPA